MMALQFPIASHFARQFSKLEADLLPPMLGPGEAPWTTGPQSESGYFSAQSFCTSARGVFDALHAFSGVGSHGFTS